MQRISGSLKSKIRCITITYNSLEILLVLLINQQDIITITADRVLVSYYRTTLPAITFNQTFTTTYYGSYTLIIESHGPFQISPRNDNPIWYKVLGYDSGGNLKFSYNVMYDIIKPNQDPYGRTYYDGQYVYPAGILLTVSHSLPKTIYAPSGGRIYVTNDYNDIGPYSKISIFVNKLELWELDQFGNEVRKILETTSSSITFAMFGNYKLKRYFGYTATEYSPPPATTVTYTTTITNPPTVTYIEYNDKIIWIPVRANGKTQTYDFYKKVDPPYTHIEVTKQIADNKGNGIAFLKSEQTADGYILLKGYAIFTTDDPGAEMYFEVDYKEWTYIPL